MSPRLLRMPLRPLVWLALTVYLASSAGLPLPTVQTAASQERFPCQGHGCGCPDAEHCWRQCCCFTHEQKLAWARRNGITPPARLLAQQAPPKSCCSAQRTTHACCATPAAKSCCQPRSVAKSATKVVWQSGLRAQRCRGQATGWLLCEPGVVPPLVKLPSVVPPCVDRLDLMSETAQAIAAVPPVPPPRAAASV